MHRLIETGRGGMGFFADWCDCQRDNNDRKRLWKFRHRRHRQDAIMQNSGGRLALFRGAD
jgi:hypothetical protein